MADKPEKIEKKCETCNFYSEGIGVLNALGKPWMWKDCTKSWGKPQFIGVVKNLCGAYQTKKETNDGAAQ